MPTPFDILTTDYGDLIVANGDFVVGDSTLHHQRDIIVSRDGEWKQNPLGFVGIVDFLDEDNTDEMLRSIRRCLTLDGQKVERVEYKNEELKVRASYE